MRPSDWFEVQGDNVLWEPAPAAAETVIDLLLETCLWYPYWFHLIVITRLMTFLWRKQMGKGNDLLFTVPVGTSFWNLETHEPLIIAFFIPIISRRK